VWFSCCTGLIVPEAASRGRDDTGARSLATCAYSEFWLDGGFDVVALRWLVVGWLVSLVLGLGLVGSVRFGPGWGVGGVLPA
jgi:hypothetical protein